MLGSAGGPVRSVHLGFALFGCFWGAWGAALPAVRDRAGLDEAQLGVALLAIAAGALPAMLVTGRAIDRWGARVTTVALAGFGAAAPVVVAAGRDLPTLAVGLALLGACSGAVDVGVNTAAGAAERARGRPVVTRAHATFSVAVVVSSLGTGQALALGAPVVAPFLAVAALAVVVTAVRRPSSGGHRSVAADTPWRQAALLPLLAVGALGAAAFAVENSHQSWSAVVLADVLAAGPGLAATAPAAFAAVVAVTRLAAGRLPADRAPVVLVAGATVAAAGTATLAGAPSVPVALAGVALAAAGTAVLFPLLLSWVGARVEERRRGTATSLVTAVSYGGFLLGPVYVGSVAQAAGLRGAMVAVAAVAVLLAVLAWPVLRGAGPRLVAVARPPGDPAGGREATDGAGARTTTRDGGDAGPGSRRPAR